VHESDQVVTDVLDAGAHGYVLKTEAGRTLVEAIGALLGDRTFVSERVHDVADRRTGTRRAAAERPAPGRLTPREREVVQLLPRRNSRTAYRSS
jgi:DNA-binding NarL/FixJ family response regulator